MHFAQLARFDLADMTADQKRKKKRKIYFLGFNQPDTPYGLLIWWRLYLQGFVIDHLRREGCRMFCRCSTDRSCPTIGPKQQPQAVKNVAATRDLSSAKPRGTKFPNTRRMLVGPLSQIDESSFKRIGPRVDEYRVLRTAQIQMKMGHPALCSM